MNERMKYVSHPAFILSPNPRKTEEKSIEIELIYFLFANKCEECV